MTVIFSHGFRGEKTGPNRTFVRAARRLAAAGVSSLRFDQYGSGDSDGDFQRLAAISAPAYLVFGTADEYVSTENREALLEAAGTNVLIDTFDGYPHSAWTAAQADDIILRSVSFLEQHLTAGHQQAR